MSIVLAVNSHDALVEALLAIMAMVAEGGLSTKVSEQCRAALKLAEGD